MHVLNIYIHKVIMLMFYSSEANLLLSNQFHTARGMPESKKFKVQFWQVKLLHLYIDLSNNTFLKEEKKSHCCYLHIFILFMGEFRLLSYLYLAR